MNNSNYVYTKLPRTLIIIAVIGIIICIFLLVLAVVYSPLKIHSLEKVEFDNIFSKLIEFRNQCVANPSTRTFGYSTTDDRGKYEVISFDCDALIKAYKTNK